MSSILAARSDFSLGESTLTIDKLIEAARSVHNPDMGIPNIVALTDTMSVTGMVEFSKAAVKAGIKPIIGCRLRLVDDIAWRKSVGAKKAPPEYFVTAYVLEEAGLQALFRLLTLANDDDHFYNVPKLSFEDLFTEIEALPANSLAISTGDVASVVRHPDALSLLERIGRAVGASNAYVALCPINTPYWDAHNVAAVELGHKAHLPFLSIYPCFYEKDGCDAHEIIGAIVRNNKLADPWHLSNHWRGFFPISTADLDRHLDEAAKRILDQRGADLKFPFFHGFLNAKALADKASYAWEKAPVSLPFMAADEIGEVIKKCKTGWEERFTTPVFAHRPTPEELRNIYKPRLVYELGILKSLGFAGYFLLVEDLVRFAKSEGILVGPGRGSVGGSLVAYLLGITDCDPIRFGLLFERFINPERLDLPDADLDFMSGRRHEVLEYLVDKYGEKRVAGISNFSTLGPASAIRDISRVFGLTEELYRCSKFVPKLHGQSLSLEDSAKAVSDIAAFRDRFPPIWNTALKLEGNMRNLGKHAAGVVVAGCDLVERGVIERRSGERAINWDKRIVEDQGLVKIDVLGLSTLDLIDMTLKYIRKRHSKAVNLLRIPLDDAKVLDNFAKGISTGVFQFESAGMRRLLRDLGADGTLCFDDIAAATALYRPGPMDSGMMDSYVKRKQGLEVVEYDHPIMRETLADTYGVMVYQEQVMKASQLVAGYTMPEADKLRKIMGKKLPEEMKKERGKFVEGCITTSGMSEYEAGELFDKIEKFAGYGFNKSHSVEYSLISYQSMWLKTHYPVEFFAAALSLMDDEKLPGLLKDAERLGIEIVLPDVNLSGTNFEILTDTKLAVPFTRVKGFTSKTAEVIVEARKAGPFVSPEDFESRCRSRLVHKGKIEALTKIGAFASIDATQPGQRDPSRIKDQRELIPGLISANVPVLRDLNRDKFAKAKIGVLVKHWCDNHLNAPAAVLGRSAKFMVVTDCPSKSEIEQGRMAWGNSFIPINDALRENGLSIADGYWTALLKRAKEGRTVTPDEIKTFSPYLKKEIEILKPPVIVLMGSAITREFIKDFKGKASDQAGQVIYSPELDANLVIGFSPGEIYHSPEKQAEMNKIFAVVAELLE